MSQTIYFNQLAFTVDQKTIVKGVNIDLSSGEIVGLFGPNGAGKTTTFMMMVGLNSPSSGQIFFNKKDITKVPIYRRSELGIGYLSQEASVFQNLTTEENILVALELAKKGKQDKRILQKKCDDLLQEYHLTESRLTQSKMLSGGQKRRLEIARVMAQNPKLIFLDEPFAGVDPLSIHEMKLIISQLKNKNIGIMISDHNVRDTLPFCDRAYIMVSGKVIAEGSPSDIIANKDAQKHYFGSTFDR
ncbi:MAG: LPS export ABC transporter ATP-binding protein [Candidatus Comchoanobacterales bacterium]